VFPLYDASVKVVALYTSNDTVVAAGASVKRWGAWTPSDLEKTICADVNLAPLMEEISYAVNKRLGLLFEQHDRVYESVLCTLVVPLSANVM